MGVNCLDVFLLSRLFPLLPFLSSALLSVFFLRPTESGRPRQRRRRAREGDVVFPKVGPEVFLLLVQATHHGAAPARRRPELVVRGRLLAAQAEHAEALPHAGLFPYASAAAAAAALLMVVAVGLVASAAVGGVAAAFAALAAGGVEGLGGLDAEEARALVGGGDVPAPCPAVGPQGARADRRSAVAAAAAATGHDDGQAARREVVRRGRVRLLALAGEEAQAGTTSLYGDGVGHAAALLGSAAALAAAASGPAAAVEGGGGGGAVRGREGVVRRRGRASPGLRHGITGLRRSEGGDFLLESAFKVYEGRKLSVAS